MGKKLDDNRIIKAIAQWIPAHVSGKVIIGIYRILDTFNIIRKSVREEHKRHNIEQLMSNDSPLKNKYIDNQREWKNIAFGKTSMSVSGCEIMAVYNILTALGIGTGPELLGELIANFEKKGAALRGAIGTSPLALRKYLGKKGVRTRLLWKNEDIDDRVQMAIATVYNDKSSLFHQIHTIAFIKDEQNGFVPYNARHNKPGYATLKEALEGVGTDPKTICILEILQG